jgi:hypothetical protein
MEIEQTGTSKGAITGEVAGGVRGRTFENSRPPQRGLIGAVTGTGERRRRGRGTTPLLPGHGGSILGQDGFRR